MKTNNKDLLDRNEGAITISHPISEGRSRRRHISVYNVFLIKALAFPFSYKEFKLT